MVTTQLIKSSIDLTEYLEGFRNVEHFLGFCRECKAYGKTWACPPYDREENFENYSVANIFGTKIVIDAESRNKKMNSEELMQATAEILEPIRAKLDAALLEMEKVVPSSRALFAGSCRSCPRGECTRPKGEPCAKPDKMRPSLEAMGFDVGKSASELLNIELQWSSDSLPEYFTLVYALFANEVVDDVSYFM